MKLRFSLLLLFVILTCASVQSKGSSKKTLPRSNPSPTRKSPTTHTTHRTHTDHGSTSSGGSSHDIFLGERGGRPTTTTKRPKTGGTSVDSSGPWDYDYRKTTPRSVRTTTAAPIVTKKYPYQNVLHTTKAPATNNPVTSIRHNNSSSLNIHNPSRDGTLSKTQSNTTAGNKPYHEGSTYRPYEYYSTGKPFHETRANESQSRSTSSFTSYRPPQGQVSYPVNSTYVIFMHMPENNGRSENQILKEALIHSGVNSVVNRIMNPSRHYHDHHYHHHHYHHEHWEPAETYDPVSPDFSESGEIAPPHTTVPVHGTASAPITNSPNPQETPATAFQYRITNEELQSISEELFNKDEFNAYKYISLNIQGHSTGVNVSDRAAGPLFKVTPTAYTIPTVQALRSLYQHYIPDSRVKENITMERRTKENVLLDVFLTTNVMSITAKWLYKHGFVMDDDYEMKDMLRRLWFTQYDGTSSAFERVFAAEVFNGTDVLGVQDWIHFDYHESNKRIDYLGFVDMLQFGDKAAMWKVDFRFDGTLRQNGTVFVGTSPELEMALYTICYYARPGDICSISLGGTTLNLYTNPYRHFDKDTIDLAIPLF